MLRKIMLAAALGALAVSGAVAADMSVKADQPFNGYPTVRGIYWGLYGEVGGGAASGISAGDVSANTGKIFEVQNNAGAFVGYAWTYSPTVSYWVEGSAGVSSLNSQSQGIGVSGPIVLDGVACAATPISNALSMLPTVNLGKFPGLPSLLGKSTVGPTMLAICGGARAQDVSANFATLSGKTWEFSPQFGLESRSLVSDHSAIFARAMYVAPAQTNCFNVGHNVGCEGLGHGLFAKIGYAF